MTKLGRRTALGALWRVFRRGRPGAPGVGQLLAAVPRMLQARFAGRYQGMTWAKLVGVAAAAGYVISPIDVLPEGFLLIVGLVDDAFILTWLAGAVLDESEHFLAWERSGQRPAARPKTVQPGKVIEGEVVK
jgi:uncharacterized membrane protein YkvA (DUF1232 family)